MGKYSGHEAEFQDGFARGKWKSVAQFAISKGIDPNNGAFKKGTKGWKKRAQAHAKSLDDISSGIAKERIIKKKADVWESVYNKLSNVGEKLAETLEEFTKANVEDTPFIFEDDEGNKIIDHKAIKSIAESAIQIHTLIKKTTTDDSIPLSAENKQKIEEAKQIKAEEKGGNDDNLIEDRIKAKMKAHGFD
jgi:hypothetical protein